MTDLYNGKIVTSWMDEDIVFVSTPFVTIHIPIEEFHDFCLDIVKTYTKFNEIEMKNIEKEVS